MDAYSETERPMARSASRGRWWLVNIAIFLFLQLVWSAGGAWWVRRATDDWLAVAIRDDAGLVGEELARAAIVLGWIGVGLFVAGALPWLAFLVMMLLQGR